LCLCIWTSAAPPALLSLQTADVGLFSLCDGEALLTGAFGIEVQCSLGREAGVRSEWDRISGGDLGISEGHNWTGPS
jgi:hypothetical protein